MPILGREARVVDAHSFWRSGESPGAVLRYVARHLPPGVEVSTRISGGGSNGVGIFFWQLHPPAGLATRAVAVSAVEVSPVLTAVRLDGEAQWLSPRPGWERVPSDVALATAAGHGAKPGDPQAAGPQSRPIVVAAGTARRLAGWIDRQPVVQPGTFSSCAFGADQALSVGFLAGDGRLLARATESLAGGCAALTLTVAGHPGPALQDGGLQEELVRLHVIARCHPDELSLPAPVRTSAGGGPALTFTWRDISREICTVPTLADVALLGGRGHVLVGHDLHPPAGAPAVLYPGTRESVTAEFQNCPRRPLARRARLRLAPRLIWTVPLARGRPVRPCAQPLTVVP